MSSPSIVYLADEDVDDDLDGIDSTLDLTLLHERDTFDQNDDMFRSLYEDPRAILRARR